MIKYSIRTFRQKELAAANNRFLRYLLKYFVAAGIITLSFFPIYKVALQATKQNVIDETYSTFNNGFSKVNDSIVKLVTLSNTIINAQDTKGILSIYGDVQSKDSLTLLHAQDFMRNSLSSNSIAVNSYMLFKKNTTFLSKDIVSGDRSSVYGTFYSIAGYDEQQWENTLLNEDARNYFFIPSRETNWNFVPPATQVRHSTLHLVVPASTSALYTPNCVIVYMLSEDDFLSYLAPQSLIDNGFIYIKDRQNTVISEKNFTGEPLVIKEQTEQQRIGSSSYSVMQIYSKETGLTAVIGIPEWYFTDRIHSVWNFILWYALVILIIILFISFALAYSQNKPIQKMIAAVQKINPLQPGRNEYEYISNTIHSLDTECTRYKKELSEMAVSVRNNFLDRLLNGKIYTKEDNAKCQSLFAFNSEYFCVCWMKIEKPFNVADQMDEMDVTTRVNAVLKGFFAEKLSSPAYFYNGETLKTAIIFNLPMETKSDLSQLNATFLQAVTLVKEQFGRSIVFGIGTIACGTNNICISADTAQSALRLSDRGNPVHNFFDHEQRSINELFSTNMEQKLYELLLIGEYQYLEEYFNALLRHLSSCHCLHEHEVCQIFYGIRNAMESASKIILNGNSCVELPQYLKDQNLREMILSFEAPCKELCEHVASKMSAESCKQQLEIMEYIKNNFSNSSLCAVSIADRFGVSEKYVFSIIKNHTGKSLGDFIEQLRFSRAEELLRSNVDINQIPEMVGFNSINTFYKAFKRIYGVSPGKWRSNCMLLN